MGEFNNVMLLEEVIEGTLMYYREKSWRDYAGLIVRGKWRIAWKLRGCDGVAEVAGSSQCKPIPIGVAVDEQTIAVNMGNTSSGPFEPPPCNDDHLDAANYLMPKNDDGGEK